MNCFQIVSLRYWWHPAAAVCWWQVCCELLSDCIFEVLVTPWLIWFINYDQLWIAFRLYLWGIGDTGALRGNPDDVVVNCFQIVSLRYWWHPFISDLHLACGCELLSDCIFEVLVTPVDKCRSLWVRLWIAFRLYLWGIGDTMVGGLDDITPVVNCFQIVSLRYWWHLVLQALVFSPRCELLSDCIFEVLVTPVEYNRFALL